MWEKYNKATEIKVKMLAGLKRGKTVYIRTLRKSVKKVVSARKSYFSSLVRDCVLQQVTLSRVT